MKFQPKITLTKPLTKSPVAETPNISNYSTRNIKFSSNREIFNKKNQVKLPENSQVSKQSLSSIVTPEEPKNQPRLPNKTVT